MNTDCLVGRNAPSRLNPVAVRPSSQSQFGRGALALACLVSLCLACGPERKTSGQDSTKRGLTGEDRGSREGKGADGADGTGPDNALENRIAGAFELRGFDPEEPPVADAAAGVRAGGEMRVCDDSRQQDLGITTVLRRWATDTGGVFAFLQVNGADSFRLETWRRSGRPILCSADHWARVGWERAENLDGLEAQVQLQVATLRRSGTRETERFNSGVRTYRYAREGHSVGSGADGRAVVSITRRLTIGSPELPNQVKVVLRDGGKELRRTSGALFTDPAAPIMETVVRTLSTEGEGPSVLSKTIESGVLHTLQKDGTRVRTTIDRLAYLGRRRDGSFSCVPTAGSVTDEVAFDGAGVKGTVTVVRQASPNGVVLNATCSPGLSTETCSDLIQRSLARALTPYCLY